MSLVTLFQGAKGKSFFQPEVETSRPPPSLNLIVKQH